MLAAHQHDVQHRLRARCPGRAEQVSHRGGFQARHHEEAADVDHLGLADPFGGDVLGRKSGVGAGRADEPPVLALDVDDHAAGRADAVDLVQARGVHAAGDQFIEEEPAEDVLADAPGDAHADAQLRQVQRRVRGAPTDGHPHVVGLDQFARLGHSGDGRAVIVGKQDSRTQTVDSHDEFSQGSSRDDL